MKNSRTPAKVSLDEVSREFEVLYAQMQSAKSRRSVDSLLSASAEELNRTAAARAKSPTGTKRSQRRNITATLRRAIGARTRD